MISIYTSFAANNDILCNVGKSVCLRCSRYPRKAVSLFIILCGEILPWTNSVMHLDHKLTLGLSDAADIQCQLVAFLGQTNYFLAKFGSLHVDVKSRLFHSYCSSFYGCKLWRPNDKCLYTIATARRKIVRRIWAFPFTTHCTVLPSLMGGLPALGYYFHALCLTRALLFVEP